MAEFQIMSKDGLSVRASGALVYNGTYLKPGYVEFQEIASPTPIPWKTGDYVDYPRTGLRYKLYITPKSLKQGEQNRYGGSFVYENVQFFDSSKEIELAPFIDLVPYDNLVHFSTLNSVAFVGTPANVAERVQACLEYWYPSSRWRVKVVSSLDPTEDAELIETLATEAEFSISGATCLDVLDKVYETWNGLGWSFSVEGDVNTITIGAPNKRTASNTTDLYSRIGDNGLTAIARSVSNVEEMGTRLYAYGSSRNIPTDYYRSKNIKDAESVDIEHLMIPINPVASLDYDGWGLTDGVPDARLAYIEDEAAVSKYGLIPRYAYFDGSDPSLPEIFPSIEGVTIGDVIDAKAQISDTSYVPSLSRWSRADRIDEVVSAVNPSDNGGSSSNGEKYAESGDYATTGGELDSSEGENPDTLEIGHFSPSSAADIVDVAVNLTGTIRLTDTTDISGVRMVVRVLAGSATATAAQEILISPQNTDTSGVYSFSLEGATTRINLTGMSYVQILVEGYKGEGGDYAAYDYHADINAGSVFLGFNSSLGNTFTATIPQIGFNLLQYADMGNGKTISMKSGMCAGRDFPIKAATYNRGTDTWQLTVGRVKDTDTGLWFPNSDFPIESGDKYVLLDIAMPELYILMGAVRLLKAAKRLLGGISSESPFYEPQIDSKRVYNENRILREGMWMHLGADEIVDGGGDYALIDTLRIDEAVSNIPVYEVTLRKKKPIEWTETISRTSTNVSSTPVEETHQTVAPTTKTLDWFIPESYEEDGETKYRLKLNPKYEGMYAEGWVSAGGVSDQGGGGGGTGYLRDLLDVNASMSPTQGQALVWDDALGKWTAGDVSVDLTPFERIANRVTSISASSTDGQYPSARAVYNALSSKADSSALSGYLPLTGGTLNRPVAPTLPLVLYNPDAAGDSFIGFSNGTDNIKFGLRGPYSSYGLTIVDPSNNYYKVWHQGNDGSGSGLDADTVDGKHNGDLTARTCGYLGAFSGAGTTVADCKAWLAQIFSDSAFGVGDNCFVGTSYIENWDNDSAAYDPSSVHSFIKIGGGYNGVNYGQWLLSSFATNRIGYVGRSGNQWTDIKWLANTEDIDSCAKLASPNNLIHNGNEFTFIPPNYNSNIWFNHKTSDLSLSGNVTGYYFGNGQGGALAYITDGQFSGNAATATGITETSRNDEEFTYQATPVHDIADGYRIDRIKGNTIVSDGELINNCAEAIETTGFNQWDEEWELGSFYRTGEYYPVTDAIRSKNHIPVLPGEQLYFCNRGLDVYITVVFYDGAKNIISVLYESEGDVHNGSIVSCPSNAAYIKFGMAGAYGNFYKNDVCVNLSDPDRNGEYEPYWSAKTALGLSSIKVKDSNGDSLEFNGLASAGGVYDEIVSGKLTDKFVRLDLGTPAWTKSSLSNSNRDVYLTPWPSEAKPPASSSTVTNMICPIFTVVPEAATWVPGNIGYYNGNLGITVSRGSYATVADFQSAMSGVMAYIERTTPVTYELVSPVPLSGRIDGNGTMRVISDGPVAPFRGDITYGCNPGQMGADASSVKSYLDSMLEIKVVDGQPVLHSKLPLYSDSWISAGGLSDMGEEGGATYLKNLLDVDDNLVESAGYGLVYDGTQWTSEQIVPASRKINGVTLTSDVSLSLGSLSNVSVTGATNGQQLIYNGSEWIAGTPAGAKFFHGTCSTSSSSNTKVVDCPSFTSADLVAGTAIAIVMYNRCDTTSAVTINVNGTGANTLLAGFANRKAWSAGELILAVYDGSGEWDMLPTWYYTYYYGGGGSGGGGGTGSTVVVTPRLSSGTRIATITVDGSGTDLYAPSVSVTQTQGSTGGTQIASVNSTAIYAPAVTVTQVQTSGVEVARIKVGSANPVSIFAPSGSSGSSGVQTVVGRTGDVTTDQIATALTNAGYKLTDTVQDLSGYLPLTAGSSKALTNTLYTRGLLPTANASYDLGSLSAAYNNTYTKRVYLADGVYIEYDSTNRCVYVHGAGIATDSFVSAGGVSTTSN